MATRENMWVFWETMAADGLLPGSRMNNWTPEQYEQWLVTTLTALT